MTVVNTSSDASQEAALSCRPSGPSFIDGMHRIRAVEGLRGLGTDLDGDLDRAARVSEELS